MKLALAFLISATGVTAFAPSTPSTFGIASVSKSQTVAFSKPDEEEGGFDLNLEEMFEVFDAADKDKDFDEAIKEVKGGEKK